MEISLLFSFVFEEASVLLVRGCCASWNLPMVLCSLHGADRSFIPVLALAPTLVRASISFRHARLRKESQPRLLSTVQRLVLG